MTTTTPTRVLPTRSRHRTAATHRSARSIVDTATRRVERAARRAAVPAVRVAMAAVFLWFGLPKLVPGASPAEELAVRTVEVLTGGVVHGDVARVLVGGLEVVLGVALVVGRVMPLVLLVLVGHLVGTAAPLVLFPADTWRSPGIGTLEGQYIIKNLVLAAGIVVLAGWGLRRRP